MEIYVDRGTCTKREFKALRRAVRDAGLRDARVHRAEFAEAEACELPTVTGAIFSGPATVAFFGDGTKHVSKCREGDTYDSLFGLMACIARKVTGNRGHGVDDLERPLKEICKYVSNIGELEDMVWYADALCDTLHSTLGAMGVEGVADLTMGAGHKPEEPRKATCSDGVCSFGSDDKDVDQEKLRSFIRLLRDEGEL